MKSSPKSQLGVNLIEIMVVCAIIAIVTAYAYPYYKQFTEDAQKSEAKEMVLAIASKQKLYFSDSDGKYATALDSTGLNMSGPGWVCTASACANANYSVNMNVPASRDSFEICAFADPASATSCASYAGAADFKFSVTHKNAMNGDWR